MAARDFWDKLHPWIEPMIQRYGSEQEGSPADGLKAHVVGVGQKTLSQAQGSEGPAGLLFLSDGVVQIPATLTESTWKSLQEEEDHDCFSSLLNNTVYIQTYCLQFHMAPEQKRCGFYLSVGQLITISAGIPLGHTPCCTTLSSVRAKMSKTWRDLGQGPAESQNSQCDFDLSELLDEWHQMAMEDDMGTVRSLQPPTSACDPPRDNVCTATGWDADRVRCKGVERFSVPVSHLLIPEEAPLSEESETPSGLLVTSEGRTTDSPPAHQDTETVEPPVDHLELSSSPQTSSTFPKLSIVAGMMPCDPRPLSNPWDIFPPPCSDESMTSDVLPLQSPTDPVPSLPEPAPMVTSTQVPVCVSDDYQTSEQSKGEQSFLPPYQKPQPSPSHVPASNSSCSSSTSVSQDADIEEVVQRKCRKTKRIKLTPDALTTLEEEEEGAQMAWSPPSWLFENQVLSREEVARSYAAENVAANVQRKIPTTHSDGTPFRYSYPPVTTQNLEDFSKFKVPDDMLRWAVQYLLTPQETDSPSEVP